MTQTEEEEGKKITRVAAFISCKSSDMKTGPPA